jgi:hypothetical protein
VTKSSPSDFTGVQGNTDLGSEISGSTNAIAVVGRHAAMSYIEGSAAFLTKRDHARLAFDSTSLIVIRKSGKDLS